MKRSPHSQVIAILGHMRVAVVLFILLLVITYLGTVYQVDHGLIAAKRMYFDSWLIVQPFWGVPLLPLPGGYLLMTALTVNLVCGGLIRLRWGKRTLGIAITHLGILYLMIAAFTIAEFGTEGALRLDEGDTTATFSDYYQWEIAILEQQGDGAFREWRVSEDIFKDLKSNQERRYDHADLPFTLVASDFIVNCTPRPKPPMFDVPGPVIDGWYLQRLEWETLAEANVAGLHAAIEVDGQTHSQGLLWGVGQPPWNQRPWTVKVGDRQFGIQLRHTIYDLPFSITLDDFQHEFFPGTRKAKLYQSDVTVTAGNDVEQIRIEMNKPLRRGPFVAYQSGYGPPDAGPGEKMYSILAVVRNPADQWPLYACIVIGIGMLLHFGVMLFGYIQSEAKQR